MFSCLEQVCIMPARKVFEQYVAGVCARIRCACGCWHNITQDTVVFAGATIHVNAEWSWFSLTVAKLKGEPTVINIDDDDDEEAEGDVPDAGLETPKSEALSQQSKFTI